MPAILIPDPLHSAMPRIGRSLAATLLVCIASLVPSEAAVAASACDQSAGRVLSVGSGEPYPVPSAAAAVAQAGDVVRIKAGDYRGDVAVWQADSLTLCGVGGRARLFADGNSAQGKAIWVINGAGVTVEGIEFHGARVPDENGAGIRAAGGDLKVIDCGFFDNENGILGNNGAASIFVERSEFARNGHGDGQSHNLYVGQVDRLVVIASFFHEARSGHNLKSRARENRIEHSYFMDGRVGSSSYLAEFPNGGQVLLRGNLFQKGPEAENPTAISFGVEGLKWPDNLLEMVHNTVVMTRPGGNFLYIAPGTRSVRMFANLFAGRGGRLIVGSLAPERIVQERNLELQPQDLAAPDNLQAPDFWPRLPSPMRGGSAGAGTTYDHDSPQPMILRGLPPRGARYIGAIQAPRR